MDFGRTVRGYLGGNQGHPMASMDSHTHDPPTVHAACELLRSRASCMAHDSLALIRSTVGGAGKSLLQRQRRAVTSILFANDAALDS